MVFRVRKEGVLEIEGIVGVNIISYLEFNGILIDVCVYILLFIMYFNIFMVY